MKPQDKKAMSDTCRVLERSELARIACSSADGIRRETTVVIFAPDRNLRLPRNLDVELAPLRSAFQACVHADADYLPVA